MRRPALHRGGWGRRLVAAAVSAAAVVGCSGGGQSATPPGTGDVGTASTLGRPEVPRLPPPSRAGTGVVVVGGTTSSFAVTDCRLAPDPAAPTGARALVSLVGAGTTGSGVAFTVELQRFATGTAVVTYTDTLTYTDAARILQVQRIEVNGQVTDLRDPKVASALVRTRSNGMTASGLASAPGSGATDGGLIGVALDATC
ncbi:MAG: hypothetical protein ABIY48_10360 [Acidimicrobiales bacterium]